LDLDVDGGCAHPARVKQSISLITLGVADVGPATAFYRALGVINVTRDANYHMLRCSGFRWQHAWYVSDPSG
jgi:catechol 2,3-dioxygenase-like lactoylglutathione lyase family enzyme